MQQRLANDELAISLALYQARTPDIPMMAAACGFDAINVDLEHTATSLETASMLCVAAIGSGLTPFVRVPSAEPHLLTRVLDTGAVGVIVPHISSAAAARAAVEMCRFPPLGQRSVGGTNPTTGYAPLAFSELTATIQDQTIVAAMIESVAGVDDIAAIAEVEGLDMLLLGPHDLTAEMGIYGAFEDRRFLEAATAVASAARAAGKIFGIAGIKDEGLITNFVNQGLRYISAGTDAGLFMEAATGRVRSLRGIAPTPSRP